MSFSKIKASTIAIVVLSLLLAAAVASTIVLASYTATKRATTTITFTSGLSLTLTCTDPAVNLAATSNEAFTVSKTGLTASGDVITGIKGETNMASTITFNLLPTISGQNSEGKNFGLKENGRDTATNGQVAWTIVAITPAVGEPGGAEYVAPVYTDVAKVTVSFGNTTTVTAGDNQSVNTSTILVANTPTDLMTVINVAPVTGKTDNDVAGLSIVFNNYDITATTGA